MFTRTTHAIKITVQPSYLEHQSDPADDLYVWAYTVLLENHGETEVQLVSRAWRITDATGRVQEVIGPGVVGEQPVLKPGESFRYTSGVPLSTPSGIMQGRYRMIRAGGGQFEAEIPAFSLDSPQAALQPH